MHHYLPSRTIEQIKPNLLLYFGDRGEEWLERLPVILADVAALWKVSLLDPFPDLSINVVIPALCEDGREVVVKAGVPSREIETEAEALRCFDGEGAVHLIKAEEPEGLLMLERLRPGTSARASLDENEAIEVAASVICRLRRDLPINGSFPTLEEWFAGLDRYRNKHRSLSGPLPLSLVEKGEAIVLELLASTEREVLLHGDLHHGNLLVSGDEWVAIDPKGVIGDETFEVCPFLRNRIPELLREDDLRVMLERRIDRFADALELDRQRLVAWAFAESLLSAVWDADDPAQSWKKTLRIVQTMEEML